MLCERCAELERQLAEADKLLTLLGKTMEEIYLSRLSSRQASRIAVHALAEYQSWLKRRP